MGLLSDFIGGLADGMFFAACRADALASATYQEAGRIDRLCRELGWFVDERKGELILLHFNDPKGVRKVMIAGGDNSLVHFATYSFATLPAKNVTGEILVYLLQRNFSNTSVGAWSLQVDESNQGSFYFEYSALGTGLDAQTLQFICGELCKEAVDFDNKLRSSGLL